MESLSGHFLISTPQMPDPRFQQQVIYICAHNEDGAMGLVINNPNYTISLADILRAAEMEVPEGFTQPIYIGGPVEMDAGFVLFSNDYKAKTAVEVCPEIFLSRETRLLRDIGLGKGPKHYIFCLGYAGWAPGQLETELMDNSWLPLPGDFDVLFNTPDELKWKKAAAKYGIDISAFCDVVGNA
ncbi:MAG: YqgE/AlgH family protein [Desulfobulbaceae bacterium]|nr:YqgE/AlgH family protein [Desulfobulbaceae bacterium]